MTQKIRTIKRTPEMPKDARYVATDSNGHTWAYPTQPRAAVFSWVLDGYGTCFRLGNVRAPKDFRTTLRRIVDPPKKPKRKMVRVYYYAYSLDFMVFSRSKMKAEAAWRTSARADLKPGPIESALIPEPRRKGKAT